MVDEEDILIARLKSRITIGTSSASEYVAYPPVTHEELVDAERRVGFALPPFRL